MYEKEKAELIKKALLIVDELSYYDFDEIDDQENIEKLIKEAKKIRNSNLWKLN